jgi:hypothetical protein
MTTPSPGPRSLDAELEWLLHRIGLPHIGRRSSGACLRSCGSHTGIDMLPVRSMLWCTPRHQMKASSCGEPWRKPSMRPAFCVHTIVRIEFLNVQNSRPAAWVPSFSVPDVDWSSE